MENLETDYLVVGAGAVGMAFVDTLLSETDADIILVDRRHMPGGHWNDAYSFVRLHQPSAFYGVASTALGSNRIDETGPNAGLYELASGPEVTAYFEKVLRERFLPSGRVRYYPLCDYTGDGAFRSLVSSASYSVRPRKRIVDASFYTASVPATHQRKYEVAADVACVPPNDAPRLAPGRPHYAILGGGKTAMDTGVWLLNHGVDPDAITWVMPRASWLTNRTTTQPGIDFFDTSMGGFVGQLDAMIAATSIDDMFERMEACGVMLRIDPSVRPTMCHYATISTGEVDQLRRIKNVIMGERVARLEKGAMIMQSGTSHEAPADTLYIDCTATPISFSTQSVKPIFDGDTITVQAVRAPLVTTSSALIAYVEALLETDEEKNALCQPVALADTPSEWARSFMGNMINQRAWSQNKQVRNWMTQCRLDPFSAMTSGLDRNDEEKMGVMNAIREKAAPAVMNIQKLLMEEAAA